MRVVGGEVPLWCPKEMCQDLQRAVNSKILLFEIQSFYAFVFKLKEKRTQNLLNYEFVRPAWPHEAAEAFSQAPLSTPIVSASAAEGGRLLLSSQLSHRASVWGAHRVARCGSPGHTAAACVKFILMAIP